MWIIKHESGWSTKIDVHSDMPLDSYEVEDAVEQAAECAFADWWWENSDIPQVFEVFNTSGASLGRFEVEVESAPTFWINKIGE